MRRAAPQNDGHLGVHMLDEGHSTYSILLLDEGDDDIDNILKRDIEPHLEYYWLLISEAAMYML